MIKQYFLLIVFFSSFSLASLAQENTVYNKAQACSTYQLKNLGFYYELNPRSEFSEQSLLWKVTHPSSKTESFIFGSMHSDNSEVVKKARRILPLLALVDGFLSEVKHEPGLSLKSILHNSNPVSSQLHPSILPLYKESLKQRKLPYDQFNNFPLWFNFSQLSRPQVSKFNMDKIFVDEALAIGKYLDGFETTHELVNQLNKLTDVQQMSVLQEVLCSFDLISDQSALMIEAYINNQVSKAYLAGHQYHSTDFALYQAFMNALVLERNLIMARRFQEVTKARSVLAAIGYAHLIGEKGLISLLQQGGFVVEPVSENSLSLLFKDVKNRAEDDLKGFYLEKFNTFLNRSSQYQIPENTENLPPIQFVPQSELQDLACEGTPCPILGLYDSKVIRLANSLIPAILERNYQQVGIIFHEYVHFVQEEYGEFKSVVEQTPLEWSLREQEANLLQLKFVHWMNGGGVL